ncbi:MAG: hypothetical protein AB7G87_14380 [Clostridia bacterium]
MRRKIRNSQSFKYNNLNSGVQVKIKCKSIEITQSSDSHPVPDARHVWASFWMVLDGIKIVLTILGPVLPFISEFLLRHIFFFKRGSNQNWISLNANCMM